MEKMLLAKDGRTDFVLVLPAAPTPAQAFAGKEFSHLFYEITGALLPERTETDPPEPKEILLGCKTRPCLRPQPLEPALWGEEGYGIYGDGRQLYIDANSDRGLLYGVYGFFEEYLGCRWFTETLRHIPKRDQLLLSPIDTWSKPAFSFRKTASVDSDRWEFSLRNRLNARIHPDPLPEHGGEVEYAIGFAHTLEQLVPESLFATHPEYFPMNEEGKRFLGGHDTQRCLSNPQVLAMTIQAVREGFRANPHAKIASVTQSDTGPERSNNCQCPECRKIDQEEGSPAGSFLRYVNAVAEAIEEEFPDRFIDTFAYRYTRTPPKLTKPRHNVIVRLCSIECCFSHSLEGCSGEGKADTLSFLEDFRKWASMGEKGRLNLHIWDYVVNFSHYLAPHPNLHCLQDNLRFFQAHHVVGLYPEGSPDGRGSDMAELKNYLLAKLQWNPDYDVKQGTWEFLQAYCGAGAGPIWEYLQELNAKPEREGRHMGCYEPPARDFFTPEFLDFANRCFDKAEQLAENQQVLDRIRYWRMSLRYVTLWLYADRFSEGGLREEFVDFFADCKRYGISTLFEGGSYQASLMRMEKQIKQQRELGA